VRVLLVVLLLTAPAYGQAVSPLAPPSVPIATYPPSTASDTPARPVPSPIAAPVQPSRELFATSASKRRVDWWFVAAVSTATAGSYADAHETFQARRRGEVIEANPFLRERGTSLPSRNKIVFAKIGMGAAGIILHKFSPRLGKILLFSLGVSGAGAAVWNNQINR
jgi:hypothetical protein